MISYPLSIPDELPSGARLVHNFYPGPPDDPGRNCQIELDDFRIWIIDEPLGTYGNERRCHCGWLDGREHYGSVIFIDENGQARPCG